jgi:hypothetical protein
LKSGKNTAWRFYRRPLLEACYDRALAEVGLTAFRYGDLSQFMPARKPSKEVLDQVQGAIKANSPVLLKPLIEAGVSVNQKIGGEGGEYKMTLLEFAVEENAVEVVKYLIQAGAKLESGSHKPLVLAAAFNRMEIVRLLLEAGADPNVTTSEVADTGLADEHGLTTLMYAVEFPDHLEVIELLLKHHANPHLVTDHGNTALRIAVGQENIEAVRLLLNAGCKPIGPIIHGPVFRGTRKNFEIVKLLIAAGADLNAIGDREACLQHRTALEGARDMLKDKTYMIRLVERRAREDWEEGTEETLQRWKAEAQLYQEMIDELIRAKEKGATT